MKAILLAAGFGTRLRPLTDSIPKCMVEISGKPLLEIWLEKLIDANITDIIVNTHYLSNIVISFINNSAYKNYVTISHEPNLLGTAGTIINNIDNLNNETSLVIHADVIIDFDLSRLISSHFRRPSCCDITILTFKTDNPKECGIIEVNNESIVTKYVEKPIEPEGILANGGIYIIEPCVYQYILENKEICTDIAKDILPNFLNRIYTVYNNGLHRDIGTLDSLRIARNFYKDSVK